MHTETRNIFDSLEELIKNKDAAAVGDIVQVAEESLPFPKSAAYVVAHITEDKIIVVRKKIMSEYRPMKNGSFDLTIWLNGYFRDGILENLPEDLHEKVGHVILPSIMEVYGESRLGVKPDGEQFEWFKDPINRIAIKEDVEYSDWYWLRDVVSGSNFAIVGNGGSSNCYGASGTWVGVRPALSIRA